MERSTASRTLALMARNGLVETTETSPTGRSLRVTVTEDGRSALVRAETAWRTAQNDVHDAIGSDAAGTMDDWLESLGGRGF